tara:strand:- start:1181 stop:1423 length:243 start_codon:yes stop_codon:yes gene_type:complete
MVLKKEILIIGKDKLKTNRQKIRPGRLHLSDFNLTKIEINSRNIYFESEDYGIKINICLKSKGCIKPKRKEYKRRKLKKK